MSRLKKIDAQIWLLLGLSIFAWGPLLTPAYFLKAHDAQHSLFYVVEMAETLRDGYLWPRWSPDFAFGYGYPLFNIYAPLAIYITALLHLSGFSVLTAVKIMYGGATIGAGLAMYGFVRRLYGQWPALIASLVYIYAPFHLLEIYVRSAFAEYVSLLLLPLILWAFSELIAQPSARRLVLAGGSYGLLALTHHTTFFTFTPFLMLYILVLILGRAKTDPKTWAVQVGVNATAGVLGVALAGIYLIPALFEQSFIKVEQWTSGSYDVTQHFVYFSQFLSPKWGYGYAGPGPVDDMSYQLGIVVFGLAVFALVPLNGQQGPHRGTALIFGLASLLTIWLMSPWAGWLWQVLPIAALVQFPWRLLIVTSLSLSVVVGAVIAWLKPSPPLLFVLSLVILLGSYQYIQPEYTNVPTWAQTPLAVIEWDAFSIEDRVGMVIYTEEQPHTSPLEPQYRAGEALDAGQSLSPGVTVATLHRGGASAEMGVQGAGGRVQFYTYAYPGWETRLNGQPIPHRPEPPHGLITVDVPPGEHTLSLRMGWTAPRVAGTALTWLAIFIIVAALVGPLFKN